MPAEPSIRRHPREGARLHGDAEPAVPAIEQFLHDNPQGVLTSFRRNGMPQLSIVTVYRGTVVGHLHHGTRAKSRTSCGIRAARYWSRTSTGGRAPCVRGKAELVHSGNADPEVLRLARRHIFSATTRPAQRGLGSVRPDCGDDKRVAMVVRPDHIYGSALARMREALAK